MLILVGPAFFAMRAQNATRKLNLGVVKRHNKSSFEPVAESLSAFEDSRSGSFLSREKAYHESW